MNRAPAQALLGVFLATFLAGCIGDLSATVEPIGASDYSLTADGGLGDAGIGPGQGRGDPPPTYTLVRTQNMGYLSVCSGTVSSATCVGHGRTVTARLWGAGAGGAGGDAPDSAHGGAGGHGGSSGAFISRTFVVPANANLLSIFVGAPGRGGQLNQPTGGNGESGGDATFGYNTTTGQGFELLRAQGGQAPTTGGIGQSWYWQSPTVPLGLPSSGPSESLGAYGSQGVMWLTCSGGNGGAGGATYLNYGRGGAGGHGGYRRHFPNCMSSSNNFGRTAGTDGVPGYAELSWN